MEHDVILARYGELGLKARATRRRFERILRDNIEYAFEQSGLDVVVKRVPGRFLIHTSDPGAAIPVLARVFGLTSVSRAKTVSSDLEALVPGAVEYARAWRAENPDAKAFAVRSRRSGNHPYSSQDVAVKVGAAVIEDSEAGRGMRVDLGSPDFALHVEVRGPDAYLFTEKVDAPGGLPLGTAGRVVALLKDRNSLVAAWMMMKRGCTVLPVHFEGLTGRPERAEEFETILRSWFMRGRVKRIRFDDAQEFPRELACALCVRAMIRTAAAYARRRKARTVVTGEVLDSTTMPHMPMAGEGTEMNILRPLMGLLPTMVADMAGRIGAPGQAIEDHREPCPLRIAGAVSVDKVHAWEREHGIEVERLPEGTA